MTLPPLPPLPKLVDSNGTVIGKAPEPIVLPKLVVPEPEKVWTPKDGFPNVQRLINKPMALQPAHMIRLWRRRPKIFAHDAWGASLDAWQEDAYDMYMLEQRLAMVANKGPGKTWTLATLTWHFFMTNHIPKIAVLAISKDHLKANLWAELAKLHAESDLIKLSVEPGGERMSLIGHEQYSFIDARSYPKSADATQMASTLAGLHAPNIAFVMDEVGLIPDAIIATADNALSGGESETMKKKIMCAGNPEVASGIVYRAAMGLSKQRWGVIRVTGDPDNPKRSPRVDVAWAREQIATFGKDDPWVQINVFGNYPTVATQTLLSDQDVKTSMERNIPEEDVKNHQHRMGVDVARGGVDRSVFARRKGRKGYPLEKFPSTMKGPEMAGQIAFRKRDLGIERIFVDNTGGYGSSVIDSLELFPSLDVTGIIYNTKAQDPRYFNKRTEMYFRCRDWVLAGGQLPNDPQLGEELSSLRVIYHGGKYRVEEKEELKKRIGRSPDSADSFIQTFADPEEFAFNADYSSMPEADPDRNLSDADFIAKWKARREGNHITHDSQLDNRYGRSNHIS